MSESGGGADFRNEMGPLARRVSSQFTRLLVSPRRRRIAGGMRELGRRLTGAPQRVRYFHQVDDPYSHLAAQTLVGLCDRYEIELVPQLVGPDVGANIPEPELLSAHAVRDCAAVAEHYGLEFGAGVAKPGPEEVRAVECALVAALEQGPAAFAARAVELGNALWAGDARATLELCAAARSAPAAATHAAVDAGSVLRSKLGHYSGAMFHHAGVWYWGVDRLHHLEARLAVLGSDRVGGAPSHSRPVIPMEPVGNASALELEIFASLRSPYSAIGFEPALELARRTGITHRLRPVLPMVMRGVPVPLAKQKYIVLDTHREAASLDMPFGRLLDPVGEPVRRGFSLWPWAREQGRGDAYFAAFLRAAFADGIDTSCDSGMQWVVERAGLDWGEARQHLGLPGWESELEANRLTMISELGSWGVPSFRLRGPAGEPDLCTWGQDRLWLVGREIQRRGRSR
jgi:2-hydroxychromene-2-carboxylate isomerase